MKNQSGLRTYTAEPFPPHVVANEVDEEDLHRTTGFLKDDFAKIKTSDVHFWERCARCAIQVDRLYALLYSNRQNHHKVLTFLEDYEEESDQRRLDDEREIVSKFTERMATTLDDRHQLYNLLKDYTRRWVYPRALSSHPPLELRAYGFDHPGIPIDDQDVAVLRRLTKMEALILLFPYASPGSHMRLVDEKGNEASTFDTDVLYYKMDKEDFRSVVVALEAFQKKYFESHFPGVISCGLGGEHSEEGIHYHIAVGLDVNDPEAYKLADEEIGNYFRQDLYCVPVVKENDAVKHLF